MRALVMSVWALCLAVGLAHAQVQVEPESSRLGEIRTLFGDDAEADASAASPSSNPPGGAPALPAGYQASEKTQAAIDAYALGYYENLTTGLAHRKKVFQWQYVSSIIIFYVVIGIVAIGLYFSWMQFHASRGGEVGITSIEASKEGLKLSSPVLGVIILVLSLAFFYLYLVHVYPISELG